MLIALIGWFLFYLYYNIGGRIHIVTDDSDEDRVPSSQTVVIPSRREEKSGFGPGEIRVVSEQTQTNGVLEPNGTATMKATNREGRYVHVKAIRKFIIGRIQRTSRRRRGKRQIF